MFILSLLGVILALIGVLGIVHVFDLSLAAEVVLIIAGILLIVFDQRGRFTRRAP